MGTGVRGDLKKRRELFCDIQFEIWGQFLSVCISHRSRLHHVSSRDDLCGQYLLDSFALWLPVDQRVGIDRIRVCSSRMKDLWLHLYQLPLKKRHGAEGASGYWRLHILGVQL